MLLVFCWLIEMLLLFWVWLVLVLSVVLLLLFLVKCELRWNRLLLFWGRLKLGRVIGLIWCCVRLGGSCEVSGMIIEILLLFIVLLFIWWLLLMKV